MTQPTRLMNRNFFLLWQGQLVSQLGTQAFAVGMMFWLKRATGSATAMGMIMMVSTLPLVLLGPLGGTVADRYSRRGIIIWSDVASGVAVLVLAAVMFLRPNATPLLVGWLFAVALLGGVVRAFFSPAISAAIPAIVPRSRVASANSLSEGSGRFASLVGQAAGGVLFRVLGAPVLFLVDGLTYLFSALSEMFIDIPQDIPEGGLGWRDTARQVVSDLREGLAHIRSCRGLPDLMAIAAVFNFFAMPFIVLLPFFVEDDLGARPDWYGYLLAALGAGALAGYVFAGSVTVPRRVRATLMLMSLAGLGAALVGSGSVDSTAGALAWMTFAGLCEGYFSVMGITLLQVNTPDALRGRVFGVLHTLVRGLAPIAMGLTGVVSDLLDHNSRLIFVSCGVILIATTVAAMADRRLLSFLASEDPSLSAETP